MIRIEMEPGWEDRVRAAVTEVMASKLGPAITSDAKRYAPVRTGELRESIRDYMESDTLIVEAAAPYAAYVEMGHRIVAWGHETGRVKAPQPFMRPALYTEREL